MKSKNKELYIERVRRGLKIMESSKVLICSTVKNCGESLKKNIPLVEQLRSNFRDSEIIIVENDSTDNTKDVIFNWQKNYDKVHIISEDTGEETIPPTHTTEGNPVFSVHRIRKMAEYRNKYLNYIESNSIYADFIIIIDLDIMFFSKAGVFNSLGFEKNWSVITANGKGLSPTPTPFRIFSGYLYYDGFALMEKGDNLPLTEEMIYRNQNKYRNLKLGEDFIQVDSAFNGLGIYKFESIISYRYSYKENNDINVRSICEHSVIHEKIRKEKEGSIFINPSMLLYYNNYTLILKRIIKKLRGV